MYSAESVSAREELDIAIAMYSDSCIEEITQISGLYLYGTIVRDTACWAKVKQSSDGLRSKCEMFDAMTTSCSAVVSSEEKLERVEDCQPRVMGLATEHKVSDQEHCRDLDTENQVTK